MTLREVLTSLLLLSGVAFIGIRQMERVAWINEMRYSDGVDKANMVYIWHVFQEPKDGMPHARRPKTVNHRS